MFRLRTALFLLLPLALVATGFAMVLTVDHQRAVAAHAADRTSAANRLMLAMVDQETGLRGYILSGRQDFLEPFYTGDAAGRVAEHQIRAGAEDDAKTLALIGDFSDLKLAWQLQATNQIADRRNGDDARNLRAALARKALMDRLRGIGAQLDRRLDQRRNADLARAGREAFGEIVGLTLLLGSLAFALTWRERRQRRAAFQRELAYRQSQREFTGVIQVVRSEPEAHKLVKRHLELTVPGARATVMARNNSDNRLEPSTEIPDGSPLVERLRDAEPASCLAVRLGRRHEELSDEDRLLQCELCGGLPGGAICEPLLVGGQVIGSVLVEGASAEGEGDRHVADTVAQAAPVLANLRNLAFAERQASTDALTGLPNRRAVQDALTRLSAQASRSQWPLTAIALDLDHFKDINDRFGHDMGDTVLAHVGALLSSRVRKSDLVGRIGGEEFVILAPDTDVAGARVLAETLRGALAATRIEGLDRDVTGSFGIAVLPEHADNGGTLLRLADRALYAAKGAGRDRVEVAVAEPAPPAHAS